MKNDEKRVNAQRYFVFKIIEYFRNSYGVLQNKRYDSLPAMCREIVDIQNEINMSRVDTTHLKRGLDNLLEAFRYHWGNHPLIKNSLLKRDINYLVSRIKSDRENDNDYFITVHNSMKSIIKKLKNKSIVKIYIDVLKAEVLTYGEVDKLMDSFVSELLFQGYSLKYLEEWYMKDINPLIKGIDIDEDKILKALDEMGSLACSRNKFYVVFSCKLPRELQRELEEQREIRIRDLVIIDGSNIVNEIQEKVRVEGKYKYFYTEVMSCDKYKAIEIIKNSVEGYTEIYKMLSNKTKAIINDKTAFYISGDEVNFEKVILEDIINMSFKMVTVSKQDKIDIEDLIILRRTLNNIEGEYHEISIIERTLEMTNNALELSPSNRLLNIWSGLEYLLTFYYKDKIIERIRCIIPRAICLYYIKNKMNILWDRMKYHRFRGDLENVNICVDTVCREDNRGEYDTIKFADFLSDIINAKKLCNQFSKNIIIQREISELNCLLNNKENFALSSIKDLRELIQHDLDRIYRVRNMLVHSGSGIPENIEIFTYRLYRYVSSLISILIYYIKKNQSVTITEILYSIVESYEWYVEFIAGLNEDNVKEQLKEFVSPDYLYL